MASCLFYNGCRQTPGGAAPHEGQEQWNLHDLQSSSCHCSSSRPVVPCISPSAQGPGSAVLLWTWSGHSMARVWAAVYHRPTVACHMKEAAGSLFVCAIVRLSGEPVILQRCHLYSWWLAGPRSQSGVGIACCRSNLDIHDTHSLSISWFVAFTGVARHTPLAFRSGLISDKTLFTLHYPNKTLQLTSIRFAMDRLQYVDTAQGAKMERKSVSNGTARILNYVSCTCRRWPPHLRKHVPHE